MKTEMVSKGLDKGSDVPLSTNRKRERGVYPFPLIKGTKESSLAAILFDTPAEPLLVSEGNAFAIARVQQLQTKHTTLPRKSSLRRPMLRTGERMRRSLHQWETHGEEYVMRSCPENTQADIKGSQAERAMARRLTSLALMNRRTKKTSPLACHCF